MDDDIAELLGIEPDPAPAGLDVTSQEWLAANDGWVQVVMEAGYPREVATVMVQRWALVAEQARLEWERVAAMVRDVMAATAQTLVPVMEAVAQLAARVEAAQEAPPLRRCPTHGDLLTKGGGCRRCQFGQGRWARDAERRSSQQLHRVKR